MLPAQTTCSIYFVNHVLIHEIFTRLVSNVCKKFWHYVHSRYTDIL